MSNIEILEDYIPQLTRPSYLIVGLPDAGLVGTIATEFLVKKLGLSEFATIHAPDILPPIMHVRDGIAKSPLKFYHNGKNMIVFHSYIALPFSVINQIAKTLIDFAKKYGINNIISITGIPVENRLSATTLNSFVIGNNQQVTEEIEKMGLSKKFGEGYIAGPYAPILSYSQREKLNNIIIVVESFMDLPDPEASAIALSILSKYIGFPLDTEELLKEAEEVRERIRGLMSQTREELPKYATGRPMTYA
ncbi:carboxylate-amine ligase [Sulfolobus acidocaldarius SUSAZ]|nr:carboxylate-amine ligase [Sulfolobus acidocaldarius SUSAZ]